MPTTKVPGIFSSTKKNGVTIYKLRYYVPDPGKNNKLKQQLKTFQKWADAVAYKAQLQHQVRTGDYVTQVELKVKDIAEKYLAAKKLVIRPQSYLVYEMFFTRYINPKFGDIKAQRLTSVEIETATVKWSKDIGSKHVNNILARLQACYKFARKLGIKNNPVIDVERLRNQITAEEMEQLALGELMITDQMMPSRISYGRFSRMRSIRLLS